MPDGLAISIGIDVGTSGVRASALDAEGVSRARGSVRYHTLGLDPRAPETWWAAVEVVISDLRRAADLKGVQAVSVDGTSGTALAVDANGDPVGAALMYNDACPDDDVTARVEALAPATSAARGRTSGLLRMLMLQDLPGAVRVLHQADWIAGRLCGRFDFSDDNNALKTGWDPVERRWPDWVFAAGAKPDRLPEVRLPGSRVAPVGERAAALGLPARASVHAGTTDGCASFLATGASLVGDAVTALGSTLVVKMLSDRPIAAAEYGVYSHRIGERWLVGGASNTGGAVIAGLFAEAKLGALTEALKPDIETGFAYYPLLTPGERFPINDPAHKPVLDPRPEDEAVFFQAVLEGIADVEALAYRRLLELGAPPLRSVRSVGGGAANAGWTAIRQRRLAVPFLAPASDEACDGVARLALEHLAR